MIPKKQNIKKQKRGITRANTFTEEIIATRNPGTEELRSKRTESTKLKEKVEEDGEKPKKERESRRLRKTACRKKIEETSEIGNRRIGLHVVHGEWRTGLKLGKEEGTKSKKKVGLDEYATGSDKCRKGKRKKS